MLDHFDCYELCVQSPRHVASMLRAIHGGEARVLREDFCGTAAVSRRWCSEAKARGDDSRAVGVEMDERTMAKAASLAVEIAASPQLRLIRADALNPRDDSEGPDIIWVGNFSIGYIHERLALVKYLKDCRERLSRGNGGFGGGVFVCDLYGGAGAWRLGSLNRTHNGRGHEVIHYHWEHEQANPITGMVTNSISFRVIINGELAAEFPRAFVYHWRLWGLAELREAMLEAGFAAVEVHKEVNLAPGERATPVSAGELGEDWIVMVAGRTE